jgi:P pilus assembly chaperone PapD
MRSNKHLPAFIVLLIILGSVAPTQKLAAQGNLILTPKRVVFEGNRTSESINLANSGKDTARYVVSLIHLKMKEDGSFEEITQAQAGALSAEPYLRYFPRTVTLAPNEAQVIRVQLNKPAQIKPGEYRSHLYVRAVPLPTPLGQEAKEASSTIAVKLVPVFGLSIPVIIRKGETNAAVAFSDLSLNNSTKTVSFGLNRTGNASVYGDISVTHTAPDGKKTVVALVKGLAVYTPNPLRLVQLPLNTDATVDYTKGKLTALFTVSGDKNQDKKLAEAELVLQ